MATTTTIVDAALRARLAERARQTGQEVDQFVEGSCGVWQIVVDADVRFDRGVPTDLRQRLPEDARVERKPYLDSIGEEQFQIVVVA